MAVTRQPRSIAMTAVADVIALPYQMYVTGISFQGAGLTAAQRIVVRDSATAGTGTILADMVTVLTTAEVRDLWNGRAPQIVSGLSIDTGTVAGTWVVTVFLKE